jgi:CRP/FNR family transcriptional regulator, cyclic AMP receptor protein
MWGVAFDTRPERRYRWARTEELHVIESSVLEQVPIFAEFDAEALRRLVGELRPRRYRKGETIFVTGDPGTSLCIVENGRVKLTLTSSEGREVILDLLGPGETFGELALLDGEPRSADAVAVEPTTLLLLHRDTFLSFLRERPDVAINLLGVLSRRLRRDAQLVQDAAFLDVPARLARTILRLATEDEGGVLRTPRLTQSDLAAAAGTTRETLNKWLGFYIEQGLIKWDDGRATVVDADRLRRRIY